MKCHKCGFDNLDEANFCIKCGARLDQKIPCPKCGEYISNDEEKCPHCGKIIPHKKESNIKKNEETSTVRNRIAFIFNRVSTFVTLFSIIFLLALSFSNLLFFKDGSQGIEFYRYFIAQWEGFNSASNLDRTLMIGRAAIYGIDLLVSIGFAIVGIIKVARAFKNRNLITNSYKYLAILMAAKLMTLTLLIATYPDTTELYESSICQTIFAISFIHLTICLAFDCYQHFERGKISIFIARIILMMGLYLPFIIISSFKARYHIDNNGFIYQYMSSLFNLIEGNFSDGFISTFVLSSASFLLEIAILSISYSLIVYFTASYFRGMNKFRRFRIVFYMAAITLSILSSIYLISSIIEFSLLQNYLATQLSFSTISTSVFVYTVLLMGVVIATFNIYNRANRRASLEEKTTIVE